MGRASCGHVLHGVMMSMTAWGKRVCVKADFEVAHAEAFSVERTLRKVVATSRRKHEVRQAELQTRCTAR